MRLFLIMTFWFYTSSLIATPVKKTHHYTLISKQHYSHIQAKTHHDTLTLIHALPTPKTPNYLNALIKKTQRYFLNTPYVDTGANGEGNWCSNQITHHNCIHIQQDPIYRTDHFVCTTYVSQILAFIQARNLSEYNKNILMIKYGAANEPASAISYYNRNNFTSSDFNRINEKNGLLTNVMNNHQLLPYVKDASTVIDHQNWFTHLPRKSTIRVFNSTIAKHILKRFSKHYPAPSHFFKKIQQHILYIPKESLFVKIQTKRGIQYKINRHLFQLIPTPSVVEIVRNDKLWRVKDNPITKLLHSGILISHVGISYRQHFKKNDFIYPRIDCTSIKGQHTCSVSNIICKKKKGCNEIMFTQASDAFPKNYRFFRTHLNQYYCTQTAPTTTSRSLTTCNRVLSIPLSDYFMRKRNNRLIYMRNRSILGIHLEKINSIPLWKKFK